MKKGIRIPQTSISMDKGSSLKMILDREAVECLAHNFLLVDRKFRVDEFTRDAMNGIEPLALLDRGRHLAGVMRQHLPADYGQAVAMVVEVLGEPLSATGNNGMAPFFYLPHTTFVGKYGTDPTDTGVEAHFERSMRAQHELTRRFTAEFSIRPFLVRWPERTIKQLMQWTSDPSAHVRRLCSEGTRSRLPWGMRLQDFIKDPSPVLPILEVLKDDPELYVRRSVANHLGDIAKDHPELALGICRKWLRGATSERRWVIRHALRYPAKKGMEAAIKMRVQAAE